MTTLNFHILKGDIDIHRLPASAFALLPDELFIANFFSITKTEDELSVAAPASISIASQKVESGWVCLKVLGPLDFALTGILADISTTLANAGISIFALSTFDTDYILVKSHQLEKAISALVENGHRVKDF